MEPDEVEEYVNGDVTLTVHRFDTSIWPTYWIQVQKAAIQLSDADFKSLLELCRAWDEEDKALFQNDGYNKVYVFAALGVLLVIGVLLTWLVSR